MCPVLCWRVFRMGIPDGLKWNIHESILAVICSTSVGIVWRGRSRPFSEYGAKHLSLTTPMKRSFHCPHSYCNQTRKASSSARIYLTLFSFPEWSTRMSFVNIRSFHDQLLSSRNFSHQELIQILFFITLDVMVLWSSAQPVAADRCPFPSSLAPCREPFVPLHFQARSLNFQKCTADLSFCLLCIPFSLGFMSIFQLYKPEQHLSYVFSKNIFPLLQQFLPQWSCWVSWALRNERYDPTHHTSNNDRLKRLFDLVQAIKRPRFQQA